MNIKISYQTQQLPPPYAYAAVFDLNLDKIVTVAFEQAYLDRDELPVEEIEAEGFSENDDFSWKGELGKAWLEPLSTLVTIDYQDEPHDESYIHITLDDQEKGFPKDLHTLELLIQELMQGVLEAAKLEASLHIVVAKEEQQHIAFQWQFSERLFMINNTPASWDEGRRMMELLYSLDYEQMKTTKKPVANSVDLGSDVWFKVNDDRFWKQFDQLLPV